MNGKLNIILLLAILIAIIQGAQIKLPKRESRYPTREPQGLFPDVKVHHSRTYRSPQPESYKWDEQVMNDNIMPRNQDGLLIGKPGKLYKERARKIMKWEENKMKAIMTNDLDDEYDDEGQPKKRRRVM